MEIYGVEFKLILHNNRNILFIMICFTFVEHKNFGTLYSIYSMHSIRKMLNEKCLKFILLFFFCFYIIIQFYRSIRTINELKINK